MLAKAAKIVVALYETPCNYFARYVGMRLRSLLQLPFTTSTIARVRSVTFTISFVFSYASSYLVTKCVRRKARNS
jgi:hypothetical protein